MLTDLFISDADPDQGINRRTINLATNPAALTIMTGSRLLNNASQHYQKNFAIGAVEWRLMVVLAKEPGSRVSRITQVTEMDKAAVSRTLGKLERKELAMHISKPSSARNKHWKLTASGIALHDVVLEEAIQRYKNIFKGISTKELDYLCGILKKIRANLDEIEN